LKRRGRKLTRSSTSHSPSAPLRENQEFETDALPGHCSTRAMVQAYWNIGMIIVEEEQKGKATAGYEEYLISELAARLTAEFGKGFTQTNLRYMRLFYLSFEIMNASASQSPPEQIHHALRDELPVIRPELSWTHYRLLLKVERSDVREFYLDECIVANWSTRQLELEMKSRKQ